MPTPDPRPAWWYPGDDDAVASYRDWESTDYYTRSTPARLDPRDDAAMDAALRAHAHKWTCRRCAAWRSADGIDGHCTIQDTPSRDDQHCPEWSPRNVQPNP